MALFDLINWRKSMEILLQRSDQSFYGQDEISQSKASSTQDLSSLEKWGLISTS